MKILIIGLGSIARKHITALRTIDKNYRLFALRSSKQAENFPGVHNLYSWEDIDPSEFDFALISNPTYLHHDVLEKLKAAPLPLFIEKPLFDKTSEELRALVKSFKSQNRITYVGCNLRFHDALNKLKDLLTTERVNEVNAYCGSYLPDWRPGRDFRKVYSSQAKMGGGAHLDLIHELDYVYWIFGRPSKTAKFLKNSSHLDISAVDYAHYLWEYPGFCTSIVLNYYRRTPKRQLEVVCENGTYIVDILQNTITFESKIIFSSQQKPIDTYLPQMKFFIDRLLTGKESFNKAQEAYKILELCTVD